MAQTLPTTPIISVIVATRNRRELLQQFINGLRVLPDEPAWELIVVDNGSSDGTSGLLSTIEAVLPAVVVCEPHPGKSRALNRALKYARGEILLFTDDDVSPDPNWLTALHAASSENPNANIFGGRIRVDSERIPDWIMKSSTLKAILVSEQDFGNENLWFGQDQYPVGPNLAVRRRLFEKRLVGWPVHLGPGTRIPVGDERAFLMQLSAADSCDRLYVAASVVRHNVHGRELGIVNALGRCFLGGYAAGLVGRVPGGAQTRGEKSFTRQAWRRFCGLSSFREFTCVVARAVGVITGSVSPFDRGVYG